MVVEPITRHITHHQRVLPRDKQIRALVGESEGMAPFIEEARDMHSHIGTGGAEIEMTTLRALHEQYGVPNVVSIDTEGHDADVVAGNDWTRFTPDVVLVEQAVPILESYGYHTHAVTPNNHIYAHEDFLERRKVHKESNRREQT